MLRSKSVQAHGILKIRSYNLHHVRPNIKLQETQHELSLAKEKSESAWNEAAKSIFLLDEQSKKIEELSDHMKELKEYYAMHPNVSIVSSIATSSDGMHDIESVEASSSSIVMKKIP